MNNGLRERERERGISFWSPRHLHSIIPCGFRIVTCGFFDVPDSCLGTIITWSTKTACINESNKIIQIIKCHPKYQVDFGQRLVLLVGCSFSLWAPGGHWVIYCAYLPKFSTLLTGMEHTNDPLHCFLCLHRNPFHNCSIDCLLRERWSESLALVSLKSSDFAANSWLRPQPGIRCPKEVPAIATLVKHSQLIRQQATIAQNDSIANYACPKILQQIQLDVDMKQCSHSTAVKNHLIWSKSDRFREN